MNHEKSLSEEDKQQLAALIIEFSWRIDHQKANTLFELITDDMELKLSSRAIIGKQAVIEWGIKRAKEKRITCHMVTNIRLQSAEQGLATGTSSSLAFMFEQAGMPPTTPFELREYQDEFRLVDNVWKFTSRTAHPLGLGYPPTLR